jgi:uracil-DNA glycosylase family 4
MIQSSDPENARFYTTRGGGQKAPAAPFDPGCRRCPRLADYLVDVRARHPGYHAGPVPAFGAAAPRLLVVGLAPGMHGANRTGRPFTGDFAGELLYRTLHRYGFASAPAAVSADDGLRLDGARITNAVRCVPPGNRPLPAEVRACNGYLRHDLAALAPRPAILALGAVAHGAVLAAQDLRAAAFPFAHAAVHSLPGGATLYDSYHCSRYNTQTRRLTAAMFEQVVAAVRAHLDNSAAVAAAP